MAGMTRKHKTHSANTGDTIASLTYSAKRKNIPPAGLEAQGVVQEAPRLRHDYNPHLPPLLRTATDPTATDHLPELLQTARQRALTEEEARLLADALRNHEPWLEWSGKREKPWFEVEPVALHMHERVSTQAILRVLAREDVQRDMFADPQLDYAKAVQFYRHDVDWANRMILGDSLQVMASLAHREDLAGKVQMIYLDPPYGIKFASNFQPQLGQRDVKDREQDLTREPEMVKAYRDTWTLGIHSYLAYLRDRLALARTLLADSGSIFVQISDENLHRVRLIMDEVYGKEHFVSCISYRTSVGLDATYLDRVTDYILWYARDLEKVKYRQLYKSLERGQEGATRYKSILFPNGHIRPISEEEEENLSLLPEGCRFFTDQGLTSRTGTESERFNVVFEANKFRPKTGKWRSNPEGMKRVLGAERVLRAGDTIRFAKFFDDFGAMAVNNFWNDVGGGIASRSDPKIYVVQTSATIIQRCLLMTTDPGDLVLDPTCGSGTTAYVAEQWGRRWITIDTSRVALALAKHRLLTAKFDYYRLRELNAEDVARNPDGTWLKSGFPSPSKGEGQGEGDKKGTNPPLSHSLPPGERGQNRTLPQESEGTKGKFTFLCKTVPHITLKSIARNTSLDPIFAKHEPILAEKLARLNETLNAHAEAQSREGKALREKLVRKLKAKFREEKAAAVTEADRRRWILPGTDAFHFAAAVGVLTAKQAADLRAFASSREKAWQEWEVPFDSDPDWPQPLQDALTAYRVAWRAKMDAVNACIAANAEMEELVDKPEIVRGTVRVSGPFSMEGVIAVEDSPDTPIGGAPDELDTFDGDAAVTNAEAHLDKIVRLLKASGVDFPGNKNMKFSRLDPFTSASLLHAEGEWMNGDQQDRRVAISIGPEIGNVAAMQVEDAIRDANRKGYDDVVFAGFGFDAAAQDAIESASHPKLRLHMALIRPDVAMGDLLKTQPGSQLFTVFSAPRVLGPTKQKDGEFVVEVEGMDVYDPVSNALFPTNKERIAAWFLDTDYDGRTFCICQAFFPDKSKWAKLAKALSGSGIIEEEAFEALSGLQSLPFPRPARLGKGETWRVAVKVIDPRGTEGLRVLTVGRGEDQAP